MSSMSTTTFPSSACSFTNQRRRRRRRRSPLALKRAHLLLHRISCKADHDEKHQYSESSSSIDSQTLKLDRRNMLIALGGGLYGGATTSGQEATANPIQPPDISKCTISANGANCCPPNSKNIIDFQLPSPSSPLRVRPAAHLVDNTYIRKYRRAVQLMRALPANDPRSFMQQANVHCTYCDGAYVQAGVPNNKKLELQIHSSWLFFPWHRYFLYFHERILGRLINDDTFALPYWNWDAPAGMRMPSFYTTPTTSNPLYNALRDVPHQPLSLMDLDYNFTDYNLPAQQQIDLNLTVMYRQVVTNKKAQLFMGSPYRAGDAPNPGAGSVENVPHNTVHDWTGDRRQKNHEDMGIFYSAARDPIFYAHHGNVDRMWYLWQKYVVKKTQNFDDRDWLDAAFLFYDENKRLVKVRVRDCLDNRWLRYTYQDVDIPWLTKRPTPKADRSAAARARFTEARFPITLNEAASVTVTRPRVGRSRAEKAAETEVLVVDGIQIRGNQLIKFDVYVNAPQFAGIRADATEFAGSFVNLPHTHAASDAQGMSVRTTLRLSITEILDDLGVDRERSIVVTLVPRKGAPVIGSIRIEFYS